jgi:glycosyl transferase family 2
VTTPLISVLMPVRNVERFVEQAIASVLAQTFEDFELIVVDDASTDETLPHVESFDDPRIRILRHDVARGVAATLNDALAHARGSLLARMDGDDVAHPDRFETQVRYLGEHPEVGLLGSNCLLIDSDGQVRGATDVVQSAAEVGWEMLFGCQVAHPTIMMRTDVLHAAGGYPEDAPHAEDYALWLQLLPHVPMGNVADRLLSYRLHPNQVSIQHNPVQVATSDRGRGLALSALLGIELDETMIGWWNVAARQQPLESGVALQTVASLLIQASQAYIRRSGISVLEQHGVIGRVCQRLSVLAQLHRGLFPADAQAVDGYAGGLLQPQDEDPFSPNATSLPLDGRRQVTFLHEINWHGEFWKTVVAAYARAFATEADVTLALWVDPDAGVSDTEACARIEHALRSEGLDPADMADVLLVTDRLDATGLATLYAAADWVICQVPAHAVRARRSGAQILTDVAAVTWQAARWTRAAAQPVAA